MNEEKYFRNHQDYQKLLNTNYDEVKIPEKVIATNLGTVLRLEKGKRCIVVIKSQENNIYEIMYDEIEKKFNSIEDLNEFIKNYFIK